VPVVAVLPNSPAAQAKIQRGDVIEKFDGREVRNITELRRLVSQVELNKKVDVQVERGGKPVTVSATIKEQPANYGLARALPPETQGPLQVPSPNEPGQSDNNQGQPSNSALASIEVRELTPQLAQKLGVPAGIRGVVVAQAGSTGDSGSLRAGDVIEAVNQEPVNSVQDYERAIQDLDPNQPQVLSVCRQRTRSFLVVKPG
jgi:serine protease Do